MNSYKWFFVVLLSLLIILSWFSAGGSAEPVSFWDVFFLDAVILGIIGAIFPHQPRKEKK